MRASDLITGESYRHISSPNYGWAKAIKILKPKEAENTSSRVIVKCEWSTDKNGNFGLIKYFRPINLLIAGKEG